MAFSTQLDSSIWNAVVALTLEQSLGYAKLHKSLYPSNLSHCAWVNKTARVLQQHHEGPRKCHVDLAQCCLPLSAVLVKRWVISPISHRPIPDECDVQQKHASRVLTVPAARMLLCTVCTSIHP